MNLKIKVSESEGICVWGGERERMCESVRGSRCVSMHEWESAQVSSNVCVSEFEHENEYPKYGWACVTCASDTVYIRIAMSASLMHVQCYNRDLAASTRIFARDLMKLRH